jgi:hypothetical protein
MNVKELAEQVGMSNTLGCFWQCGDNDLERFAELVRADEREACAKALETGVDFKGIETEPLLWKLCLDVVVGCIAVIRARGNE